MALELNHKICEAGDQFLNADVLSDVMSRVDGATLARLSCVNTQFRSVSQGEPLWEKLCNDRWPSTKQISVKALIYSSGGFRKLYKNCFPFASQSQVEEKSAYSEADFVSIVDVTYNGDHVLSRVVDGIPGAGALHGPLVDILGADGVAIYSADDGPSVTIHTKEIPRTRDGRFWMALCSQLRVTWILLHKKTHRMVNLASWKPLNGIQHRPYDDNHFLLRFGSILSSPNSTPIHCNITMRCRPLEQPSAITVVKLTDLGLTLEDIHSVHVRGDEAVAVLSVALYCDKTTTESKMTTSFFEFVATQTSNRKALIRRNNLREKAYAHGSMHWRRQTLEQRMRDRSLCIAQHAARCCI